MEPNPEFNLWGFKLEASKIMEAVRLQAMDDTTASDVRKMAAYLAIAFREDCFLKRTITNYDNNPSPVVDVDVFSLLWWSSCMFVLGRHVGKSQKRKKKPKDETVDLKWSNPEGMLRAYESIVNTFEQLDPVAEDGIKLITNSKAFSDAIHLYLMHGAIPSIHTAGIVTGVLLERNRRESEELANMLKEKDA